MRRLPLILILSALAYAVAPLQGEAVAAGPGLGGLFPPPATAGADDDLRVLVKFRRGTDAAERAASHRRKGTRVANALGPQAIQVVRIEPGDSVPSAVARYRADPLVEYAEPNRRVTKSVRPNDPLFPGNGSFSADLWGLDNTGQRGGHGDADVDAPEGWDVLGLDGSPWAAGDFAVGVIDTGIVTGHEDLTGKVAGTCRSALAGDGTLTPGCADGDGHGTHVAGTIAAVGNNGKGIVGVAPQARVYACKALDDEGKGFLADVIACMNEIVARRAEHNIRVINMSLGSDAPSNAERDAVDYAWDNGLLVVAAAGNDGTSATTYPAGYARAVSVAATDRLDTHASFSNANSDVEVSAPGVEIVSLGTSPTGYAVMSGTSMATPHAAAIAASIAARTPALTVQQVRDALAASVDDLGPAGRDPQFGFGRVNLCRALGGACTYTARVVAPPPDPDPEPEPTPQPLPAPVPAPDTTAPPSPTGLSATAAAGGVSLDWADSHAADLAGYRVYRTGPDGGVSTSTAASSARTDTSAAAGVTYRYSVSAYDSAGNESARSAETTTRLPLTAQFRPAGYKVLSGRVFSGSLRRLFTNDRSRLEVSSTRTRSGYVSSLYAHASISARQRTGLRKLAISYDGGMSRRGTTVTLMAYKWSTRRWVTVDKPRRGTTSDRSFTWVAPSSGRNYVSRSGQVWFRVKAQRSGAFSTRTDLVRFAVEY